MSQPSELARAYARPDIAQLKADAAQWHRYYLYAFDGGHSLKPKKQIPPELEAPDFGYFRMPRDEAHNHVLAMMMIVLAEIDDEAFMDFWAWGDFWAMLPDIDPALLERIELEARRTPRFRWMLSFIRFTSARPKVQRALERLVESVDLAAPMPPRPWA